MNKNFAYISIISLLSSCQYFDLEQKSNDYSRLIASVYNINLYEKDVIDLIPTNSTKEDSLLLVKSIVNSWAKQQLLLKKAEDNLTREDRDKNIRLVQDYRRGLLVNGYKERLIKQRLDTLISEEEIENYYDANKQNFRLNEELIKIRYLHFGIDILNRKTIVKLFKSEDYDDLAALQNQELNFKGLSLNDSTWVKVDDVLLEISKFIEYPREKLLKKIKFIQKEDSLGIYLVAVKDVLKKNDIAPINYISPTVKQIILHRRKLELIRKIEKTLIDDAIQNKNFKEY